MFASTYIKYICATGRYSKSLTCLPFFKSRCCLISGSMIRILTGVVRSYPADAIGNRARMNLLLKLVSTQYPPGIHQLIFETLVGWNVQHLRQPLLVLKCNGDDYDEGGSFVVFCTWVENSKQIKPDAMPWCHYGAIMMPWWCHTEIFCLTFAHL